ncbi:ribosome small subunit-dependent GTPase A [Clostridium cylindrosporum]|uniref:Small ribosomal subunit biogenesis GTPase RsgA n=1 Tax=Clostridium cylindrosporum DSM 605 TaxID=1121307 RepID=A0A0J8D6H6_CLOCY|nr:ribosome small subunit-dependent GTPase A [Clostridium cylindrosporum]KMT21457.1 putative ribosome biogenesis GTPase RsgA [Clostridium cylindrosporum DSM 605]
MNQGVIVKGIAGFYYVRVESGEIIECSARGKFRKSKLTPLVGDRVAISMIDETHGTIEEIKTRESLLIRPNVANVNQAIVVFALKDPDINYTLLNKILIVIEHYGIDATICLNKSDLDDFEFEKVKKIYKTIGYDVLKVNALTGEGIDALREKLKGKISVFAGPSGVGKSTISNNIQKDIIMETGGLSKKISRGKHTTRHAQLIEVSNDTYIVDTPGFSSIDLSFIKADELQYVFKEFKVGECKFSSCLHHKEIGCKIKEDLENGLIPQERYTAYINILEELQDNRRGNR